MFAPSSYQKPSTQTYAVINCRILFDRCGIEVSASHRANDDDLEVWHFIQHIQQSFPAPLIEQAVKQQFKSPSLPKNFNSEIIKDSPDEPGVHVFQDSVRRPLYIGKSLNIKKRVLSHLSADHKSETELKISQRLEGEPQIRPQAKMFDIDTYKIQDSALVSFG